MDIFSQDVRRIFGPIWIQWNDSVCGLYYTHLYCIVIESDRNSWVLDINLVTFISVQKNLITFSIVVTQWSWFNSSVANKSRLSLDALETFCVLGNSLEKSVSSIYHRELDEIISVCSYFRCLKPCIRILWCYVDFMNETSQGS